MTTVNKTRKVFIFLGKDKLFLTFPKCETLSHKLTWSHYFEIHKCDDELKMLLEQKPFNENEDEL